MKWLVVFALFATLGASAQEKKQKKQAKAPLRSSPKYTATAWTRGSVKSLRKMFPPGMPVRILAGKEERERDRAAGYIPPRDRNAIFRKIGIETKISKMDELDKDMLVMSAREYSVAILRKEYPMLNEKQLVALKAEIGRRK